MVKGCVERVRWGSWARTRPCKGAVVRTTEDGKHYCAAHDPERIAARVAAAKAQEDAYDRHNREVLAKAQRLAHRLREASGCDERWNTAVYYSPTSRRPTGAVTINAALAERLIERCALLDAVATELATGNYDAADIVARIRQGAK